MTARRATRRGERIKIETRKTRRWIIPKGWPIKGLRPPKSAAREAYEEAGIRGTVGAKSIGVFSYEKVLEANGGTVPCEVRVFPMIVKRQLDAWPEAHEREARWFDSTKALSVTREKGLHQLIEFICAKDDCQKTARLARRSRTKSSGLMAENPRVYRGRIRKRSRAKS